MVPAQVNAYYSPTENKIGKITFIKITLKLFGNALNISSLDGIRYMDSYLISFVSVFPAGILHSPFYDYRAPR